MSSSSKKKNHQVTKDDLEKHVATFVTREEFEQMRSELLNTQGLTVRNFNAVIANLTSQLQFSSQQLRRTQTGLRKAETFMHQNGLSQLWMEHNKKST